MTCDGGVTIIPEGMDWPDEEVLTEVFDEQEARARALAQLSEDQSWFAARKITHHVLQQHAVAEGPGGTDLLQSRSDGSQQRYRACPGQGHG